MGYGLWVMGYGLGLWVMGYGLWVNRCSGSRVNGYGLCVMGFGFWVLGFGLWVMGYGLWVMGYGLGSLAVGIGKNREVTEAKRPKMYKSSFRPRVSAQKEWLHGHETRFLGVFEYAEFIGEVRFDVPSTVVT